MSQQTRSTQESIVRDADPTTVKRAQWEAFEFAVEAPGLIRVNNESHENPEDHSYLVNVENGEPVACECKSFQYNDGPCKHLLAVVIREPVLKAAQSVPIPDGGRTWRPARTVRRVAVDHRGATSPALSAINPRRGEPPELNETPGEGVPPILP